MYQNLTKWKFTIFKHDTEIAKKGVQKFEYRIDIDSAIVSDGDTIRFILNE
jgi:hypothetical protein